MGNFAELKINKKKYKLPVIKGTEGETAIDVTSLRGDSGAITLDVGFKNTVKLLDFRSSSIEIWRR